LSVEPLLLVVVVVVVLPDAGLSLAAGLDVSVFAPSFSFDGVAAGPLVDEVDERESVMYQPLPLKTMPTGWMTLRSAPPHCSHVVSGASEKLCRFSITSLQAVQV
jgi:hypothetical protein